MSKGRNATKKVGNHCTKTYLALFFCITRFTKSIALVFFFDAPTATYTTNIPAEPGQQKAINRQEHKQNF